MMKAASRLQSGSGSFLSMIESTGSSSSTNDLRHHCPSLRLSELQVSHFSKFFNEHDIHQMLASSSTTHLLLGLFRHSFNTTDDNVHERKARDGRLRL